MKTTHPCPSTEPIIESNDNDQSHLISCPENKSTPEDRSYRLLNFTVNHIWGGEGYSKGAYRAKITVKSKGGFGIGELYFIDECSYNPIKEHQNPKPDSINIGPVGPFKLYFPVSTLSAILAQLHLINCIPPGGCHVHLTYYDREWCIETMGDTPILDSNKS